MSRFSESLASGKFLVTADLIYPEGLDIGPLLKGVMTLRTRVDAFHITRGDKPFMAIAPLSLAHHLLGKGVEPILQFTSRARGPVGLQKELLSTFAMGVRNLLFVDGGEAEGGPRMAADTLTLVEGATGLNLLMTHGPGDGGSIPFASASPWTPKLPIRKMRSAE